jgi:hypothetical protein
MGLQNIDFKTITAPGMGHILKKDCIQSIRNGNK